MLKQTSGSVEASVNAARRHPAAQEKWDHDPDARCSLEKEAVIAECDRLERHYWVVNYNRSRVLPLLCSADGCFNKAVKLIIVNCHGVMVEVAAWADHKSRHGHRIDRF